MRPGPLLRRLASWALVAAAVVYLYLTVAHNWRQLESFDWRVAPAALAASIVAHVVVLGFGVFIWSRVLRHFDAPTLGIGRLLRIWGISNLTRYVPGAVWQFLTAAQLSRVEGLPGVLALTSMLVHVGISLLAAMVVAAATLPSAEWLGVLASPPARVALVAAAVAAVHPRVLNGLLRLVPRALHREVLVWRGAWNDGVRLLALAVGSWLAYGAAYYLFVDSLAPVTIDALPRLVAVNALAFTAGYAAVLAPGGIGVRESAMTLLLRPVLPEGVAAIVSIGARLWSIAAELALTAVGIALAARERRVA